MHKIKLKSIIGKSLIIFALLYVFNACETEIVEPEISTDEYVISDYIEIGEDSIKYTAFNQLLLNTQLNGLLAIRGPFTLFLPNNEAMDAYYASKGISSASDLDIETQKELVYNHLIVAEIYSGDIGLGAIRELNALGDKLATEFVGENYQDILINKTAIIIDRDIIVSNGIIHEIDKVIEPITINVFDVVSSDPSYSLFTQALELTGISDTLKIIDFQYDPNVDKLARNYFTLLAVPNTVFNQYGINTIDEMVNYFTNAPDSVSYVYNQFYQFIEYHCLNGSHYLSDLEDDKLYPVLSFNNNVLVNIENDYMVNYIDSTETYTGFITSSSNVPAKNGTLHCINDLLPVSTLKASSIIFDICEQFEMTQGDYYMNYYKKWYDGQNTFKNIKWEGDYLQYYYKIDPGFTADVINQDMLQMIGFWWLEVTTPKIMKGKYSLSGMVKGGRICDVYVDGVKAVHITSSDSNKTPWGDFEWTETTEHTIKMVSTSSSTIFWDTIELTPIKE